MRSVSHIFKYSIMTLRIIISCFIIFVSSLCSSAQTFADEDLTYRVMYKWGLINSQAGNATLSLRTQGNNYKAMLVAHSEPWADKIYRVRDTLFATMKRDGLIATRYEKRAHEDGKYSNDIVVYERSGDNVTGHCTRIRKKNKDKPATTETKTITATGTTVDMLSVYYYLRAFDFEAMQPGETVNLNIFSGKRNEQLSLKFVGTETIKIDKTKHQAYRVDFRFTTDGKTKSSDDMAAWISTDSRHIPLRIEGKLPVGKIQVYYTGK